MLHRKGGPSPSGGSSNKQGRLGSNNDHASFDSDDDKYRRSGGDDGCVCRWLKRIGCLLVLAFFISLLVVQEEVLEQEEEHVLYLEKQMLRYNQTLTKEHTTNQKHERTLHEQLSTLEQESNQSRALLKSHISDLEHRLSLLQKTHTDDEQKQANQQGRIHSLEKYKNRIHEKIQALSKRLLLEKYGPGPHYVEIQLAFDPNSNVGAPPANNNNHNADRFTIQLAPVHDMPHTTFWFLEQVTKGLYDGNCFYRNARHVIQGGPEQTNFLSPKEIVDNPSKLKKRFHEEQLGPLLFLEYSASFPHTKYTMGYVKDGPELIINLQDNTKLHGPGGQVFHGGNPGEADPCFAKIIEGEDAVARMHQGETMPDGKFMGLKHNVAIKYMKFIGETKTTMDEGGGGGNDNDNSMQQFAELRKLKNNRANPD